MVGTDFKYYNLACCLCNNLILMSEMNPKSSGNIKLFYYLIKWHLFQYRTIFFMWGLYKLDAVYCFFFSAFILSFSEEAV